MAIPSNIRREHIIKAMEKIDISGVPDERESTKFRLVFGSKYYPPKYLISIANTFVNNEELDPSEFSGGKETNVYLEKLGFTIKRDEGILQNSFSWTVYSSVIAVKEMDKSAFIHNGTVIPKDIQNFFITKEEKELRSTKKRIELIFNDYSYEAHIYFDKTGRTRMLWYSDLANIIKKDFSDEYQEFDNGNIPKSVPRIKFTKTQQDMYTINFINEKTRKSPSKIEDDKTMMKTIISNKEYLIGRETTYYILTIKNTINNQYAYEVIVLERDNLIYHTFILQSPSRNLLKIAKKDGVRFLYNYKPQITVKDISMVHYKGDRPKGKHWIKDSKEVIEELLNLLKEERRTNILLEIVSQDIDSEILEEGNKTDGAVSNYHGKRYERNPINRLRAIEIHGLNCKVCGFNFEKVYGERGKDFIEIHHIKPLSTIQGEVVINPGTDLVPLCSNCHRMIHRRKEKVLTIEQLRGLIRN